MGLAKQFNYPTAVLRIALNAYSWDRRIMLDSIVSGPIWAHKGIGPGSTTATFELNLYFLEAVVNLASKFPSLTLTVHVDDFGAAAMGEATEVVNTLVEAGLTLKGLLNQGLEV